MRINQIVDFNMLTECPKCGSERLSRKYCESVVSYNQHPFGMTDQMYAGHLHRICGDCGYEWLERPKDSKEAENAKAS